MKTMDRPFRNHAQSDREPCSSITEVLNQFFRETEVSALRRYDAAKALHMSDRTLSRRLQEAGTTFKTQLQNFRMARALEHLETGASVKKIAYSLGFRDPSAFSHAFRRWTGQSTREYRRDDKMPRPRNWLEKPPESRVIYLAFANRAHNDEALYEDWQPITEKKDSLPDADDWQKVKDKLQYLER